MKYVYLILTIILFTTVVNGQTMNVHKTDNSTVSFNLSEIDSITFSANEIPTDSLIAYYPFNGNANDESGNGNNGTVNGASLSTDRFGNVSSAFNFNGTSDYILVNNSATFPSSAITIAFWFNRMSASPGADIDHYICKEQAFSAYLNTDSTLHSQVYKGTPGVWSDWSTSPFKISSNNNWVFFASTYDNATKIVNLYVDGVLVKTINETDPNAIVRTSTAPLYIGKNASPVYYINGKMDDIRIYSRVLSGTEVQALYHESGW